jgi:protein involved in polysaccharide export with SLBB domain
MNRKFTSVVFFLAILVTPQAFSQVRESALSDTSKGLQSFDFRSKRAGGFSNVPQNYNPDSRAGASRFGMDLFNSDAPAWQQPLAEVYVLPPRYELGPGDQIGVFLLGKVQENREITVNVEGKIFVPPVGVLDVAGLEMDELRDLLSNKLSKFYDNFKLDLMLLRPKNVLIAVVGEVAQPGKYVLSSMNTVLDAIMLAGGPTDKGSLRDIRTVRDGEVVSSIDLYQFLMSHEDTEDEFLQAGDRVFVPVALNTVRVTGEVNRPAVFELRPDPAERLTDVIVLAGGLTEYAYPNRVEISRLQEDGHRELTYLDYSEIVSGDSSSNHVLRNEDHVRIYSKLEQIHQGKVAIFGEIRKPGAYTLEANMHLSDLILKAGNLTRKAYTLEAEVAKVDPGRPTTYLKVSLENLTDGTNGHQDVLLEEDDQVFIRQIPEWEVGLTVHVRGEVMFPGTYAIVKDKTRLSEILAKTGGFTKEAFLQDATVTRPGNRSAVDKEHERLKAMRREEMTDLEYQYLVMRQNTANVEHVVVDFEKLVNENDDSQDIILEHSDIIDVPKAPKVVMVTGRVAHAGGITYTAGGNLQYYLSRAGGASWDADLRKTKVIKNTGEVLDDEDVKSFRPGDTIWVPRKPDKNIWPVVVQTIAVAAQLASIYLIIDTAKNR